MAIGTPGTLNTAGVMKSFVPLLRRGMLPSSLYGTARETPKDVVRTEEGRVRMVEPPKEIFVDIHNQFLNGRIKVQLEFLASLDKDGVRGNTTLEGDSDAEEAQTYKGLEATANMSRKAVPVYGDGYNSHTLKGYGGRKAVNSQLMAWGQDDVEYCIRHAIVEKVAPPLESAPSSLSTELHPRIFVAGDNVADGQQPADNYNTTDATWANTVGAAAMDIPSTKHGGISYDNLTRWQELFRNALVGKLNLSKGMGWIMSISTRGYQQLIRDPDIKGMLERGDVRGPNNQLFKGVIGPICDFYFWVDERLPRLHVTGAEGSRTASVSYYGHGKTDNRTGDFDINIVHGPGTLVRGNAIAPHFRKASPEDYGLLEGIAMSRTDCMMRLEYDATAATNSSWEIDGSGLIVSNRAAAIG